MMLRVTLRLPDVDAAVATRRAMLMLPRHAHA